MSQAPLTRVQLACLEAEQDLEYATFASEKARHERRLAALVALRDLDHLEPTVPGWMVGATESPYMPASAPLLADSVAKSSQDMREAA